MYRNSRLLLPFFFFLVTLNAVDAETDDGVQGSGSYAHDQEPHEGVRDDGRHSPALHGGGAVHAAGA